MVATVLVLAAIALRIAAASRPGLWADEIFSLAMTTGHSLEHPAADALPALGDFAEPHEGRPAAAYRRFAEHEEPPAGLPRVLRAVLLSDTSPPLYYLLLNPWTRAFGTGDAVLRLFSVWWAVLSLPLLWLLGRDLGGPRAAWSAVLLFSFSPVAVYYSAEGRMYSLLWFLGLGLGWLTLRLARDGGGRWLAGLWVVAGTAGLLTHYFFGFVWLACLAWLWLGGHRSRRWRVTVLAAATLCAVLPWYQEVPASLARWRVTGDWLHGELAWPRALARPIVLAGGLFTGSSDLRGWRWAELFVAGLLLATLIGIARQRSIGRLFTRPHYLLWGWLAASCLGPLAFDLLRHTTTSDIPRYVLPGLPAALLLAALGLSRLAPGTHLALLGAIVLAWLPADRSAATAKTPRPSQPYRAVDARLESWAGAGDLVLVHSTPSGVIGVARYLRADIPMASWVARLGTRAVPADLVPLLAGRRRVALVKIHHLGIPSPPEAWLRSHARLLGREAFRRSSAEVVYYAPRDGDVFFPRPSPVDRP